MTEDKNDRTIMEELLGIVRNIGGTGERIKTIGRVTWFQYKDDTENDPKDTFFSIKYDDIEVTHMAPSPWFKVEGEFRNFSDFNFAKWAEGVRAELEKNNSYLVVDGKKYKLVEA